MIPAEVRDELDGSMKWWDREFWRLLRLTFDEKPVIESEHEGHRFYEDYTYGGRRIPGCADCPIEWVPKHG